VETLLKRIITRFVGRTTVVFFCTIFWMQEVYRLSFNDETLTRCCYRVLFFLLLVPQYTHLQEQVRGKFIPADLTNKVTNLLPQSKEE
jgi:hypothetical protein